MASREFTDSRGVAWRAWDVTTADLHPRTREEEFMEPWAGGWLAFECELERRRLAHPYPGRWHEFELKQLEMLLRAATPVPMRKDTASGEHLAITEQRAAAIERAGRERTFKSPRGRLWTVRPHETFRRDAATEVVLRFTAGRTVLDLRHWPQNWKELSRDAYALLILDAEPPEIDEKQS
jgi:hypothetical protein